MSTGELGTDLPTPGLPRVPRAVGKCLSLSGQLPLESPPPSSALMGSSWLPGLSGSQGHTHSSLPGPCRLCVLTPRPLPSPQRLCPAAPHPLLWPRASLQPASPSSCPEDWLLWVKCPQPLLPGAFLTPLPSLFEYVASGGHVRSSIVF